MNLFYEFFGDPLKHADREKKAQQAKKAELTSTGSSGRRPQPGPLRFVVSLILATGGAYAFSFAFDLFLGGLLGAYPTTASLSAITWFVISGVLALAACFLSRSNPWLALPYAVFGILTFLGGLAEMHPHNFLVSGALFLQVYILRRASRLPYARSSTSGASGLARTNPGQWDAVLGKCDLLMARDGIAEMHRTLNAEAERKGGHYMFQQDYVTVWEAFRDKPSIETARALLRVAPSLLQPFQSCSIGGGLYSTNRPLKRRGL
jgi:hypothetical protein